MSGLLDALGQVDVTLHLTREEFLFVDHLSEITGLPYAELVRRIMADTLHGEKRAAVDALPRPAAGS